MGVAGFVLIPFLAFLTGCVAGAAWERSRRDLLIGGAAGLVVTSGIALGLSLIVMLGDEASTLSTAEEVANAALNGGLVFMVGAIGLGAGFGLSRLQRSRQIRGGTLVLIAAAAVLLPLILCGACLAFAYFFFADTGLELPPTATP